ncbi:putative low molecular weight protein-tyrosine-phosphatase slr0328 [Gammaproteobacteria bacterium]
MEKIKILFVCMGNICRSPTAEGVFTRLVREHHLEHRFEIDSAGTHAYHVGEAPDRRSREAAARRGVDLNALRARRVVPKDFEYYHYLLAMDRDNYDALHQAAPPQCGHKIRLFLEFAPHLPVDEVPDPYYGAQDGFEHVLDIVDAAARGLLTELQQTLLSPPR